MNPTDPQGELLPSGQPAAAPEPSLQEIRTFFERESLRSADAIGQLKRATELQRTLLVGSLVGVLVLAIGVDVLTLKQMRMTRDQLNDLRPQVQMLYSDFRQRREPLVKEFLNTLQTHAKSNREFQPILDRYRPFLQSYFTGPAAPAPVPPSVQAPGTRPSK